MRRPLTVAVSQPPCEVNDRAANAQAHAEAVRTAGARLVVFPELSLTGYQLGSDPIDTDGGLLDVIVDACSRTGACAVVGAPVRDDEERQYIASLLVSSDGARVAYRKRWLGDEEARIYAAGDDLATIDVDGWRIGLGICRDTGVDAHVARIADAGVDLYAAGVLHHAWELDMQDDRGAAIAQRCRAPVAFASFAGSAGGGYATAAGNSTVWSPSGTILTRAGTDPGDLARATLPPRGVRVDTEDRLP